MRILFLSILFLVLPHLVFAQSTIDTVNIDIDEIIVIGYETNRNILETPVSVATVNPQTINKLDASSLLFGMNTIAGVVMEERATGSYRLAIRGSSLRSPFGIRNVKVYWNGIPYTEPSGSTFLNLLDTSNMQSLEVIKGPAGSLFGAGNGGIIHIESTPPFLHDQITSSFSVGSFESLSTRLSVQNHFENGLLSFKYATQTSDGYRDQSFLDRQVFEITGTTEYTKNRELSASVLYSELNYGIPSGLNADQFASDPTQARLANPFALGSVDANASIKQEALIFGITHDATFNNRWANSSSIFGTFSDFQNPFIFDYKIDSRKSGGFRSVFKHDLNLGNQHAEINFGTEYHASSYSSRNFKNDTSKIGLLNFDDLLKVQHLTNFASLTLDLDKGWIINTGLSYNLVGYEIHRLFTTQDNDVTGKVGIDFDPQIIPRLSIAKNLNERTIMFSGFGYGFSPPTIEEIRTNEGSINQDL
jgi:iron complex outermembrane receptor protein